MSRNIIVHGDRTTHGGTVITASPSSDTHGRGWARVGDMVSCKRCRGVFPIIEGDASLIDDGKAVAYDGCLVKCGARLIGSQPFTTDDPSGGALAGGDVGDHALGVVADGKAAGYEEEPLDDKKKRYRGRFRVVDDRTGAAIVGEAVRVISADGSESGATDPDGYTAWVERDASEALSLELVSTVQA